MQWIDRRPTCQPFSIAKTANNGSEACANGQSGDARELVSQLKKNVLLVAELVAAMQLGDAADGLPQLTGPTSNHVAANAVSAPLRSMNVEQQQSTLTLGGMPTGGTLDPSSMSDGSESSRKRCASSMAGDRVVKSMKLESLDDTPPLQIPPTTINPAMMSQPRLDLSYVSSLPPVNDVPSLPSTTLSGSRPPSSAGIPPPLSLGMLHDTSQSIASSMHPSLSAESVSSLPHSPDFIPPGSATSATSTAMSGSPGFTTGSMWPDARMAGAPRQHHRHSSSTSSILNDAFAVTSSMPIAGPSSSMPYSASVYSPTRSSHLPQAPLNAASATLGRASRSQSISHLHGNPFAHVPDGVSHPTMYESTQSRPSTSGKHSPQGSSPECDNDDGGRDSEDEGDMGYQYAVLGCLCVTDAKRERSAAGPGNGTTARSHAGQRRMSRTSPSNEGGSSSGHGNEVPQEYRADVERIFFEFLNTICSNCTYARPASLPACRPPLRPAPLKLNLLCLALPPGAPPALHSGRDRLQGRADPPDAHGQEDAAAGRVPRLPPLQVPHPGVHQRLLGRGTHP